MSVSVHEIVPLARQNSSSILLSSHIGSEGTVVIIEPLVRE